MAEKELTVVQEINQELALQTKDPATMRALMATTFKGFKSEQLVKQACLEAMMNGYSFQDLMRKKVYAIPFGQGYSLVQSISDVRATAMKSGQSGKDAPRYEDNEDGTIKTCTVTVYKKGGDDRGYTATVYFDEYDKKRDNWKKMPRTMIAKVAEMHALRMAFPEELADAYIEDEFNDANPRVEEAKVDGESLKMGNFEKKDGDKKDKDETTYEPEEAPESDKGEETIERE